MVLGNVLRKANGRRLCRTLKGRHPCGPTTRFAWYRLSQAQRSLGNIPEQRKALGVFQRLHSRSLEQQNVIPHEVTQQVLDPAAAP